MQKLISTILKQLLFIVLVIGISNCVAQEKIILKTGDTVLGTLSKVDYDHSRITKPDGSTLLILTNLIKKEVSETDEEPLILKDKGKLIIGLQAAPSGAYFYGLGPLKKYGIQYFPRLGFIAGASIQYNWKNKISFNAELNYERKGVYVKSSEVEDPSGFYKSTAKQVYHVDYVTLPITTKLCFNEKDVSFYGIAGIYLGYLTKFSWTLTYREIKNMKVEGDINTAFRVDYGVVAGLGLAVPIKNKFQFSMEFKNNLGLSPLFKNATYIARNETFALQFGIGYKLK